ncbi:MAG: nucleotide exchange factor GrpE [Halorientalis sp.]
MSEPDAADQDDETPSDGQADERAVAPEDVSAEALDVDPDEDLLERVREADPEQLASEVASLRERVADLESELANTEAELDDATSQLARTKADFENYKKRMDKRREEERQRATEDLVSRLLDVRDNLVRALEQDADADIREGVETTLRQFDEELEQENVSVVEPEPGDEVDPQRHEVLLRVESDQPADTVASVERPGYEMAGKVIRTAQVTVSEGASGGDGGDATDGEA